MLDFSLRMLVQALHVMCHLLSDSVSGGEEKFFSVSRLTVRLGCFGTARSFSAASRVNEGNILE
jgi:hypothetical protein